MLVVFCSSENRLAIPGDMTALSPAFKLVSVLVMNKMSLQWEEVTFELVREERRREVGPTFLFLGAARRRRIAAVGRAPCLPEQD